MGLREAWVTVPHCPVCWLFHPHKITIPPVLEVFVPNYWHTGGLAREMELVCPNQGKTFKRTIIFHRPHHDLEPIDADLWPYDWEDAKYVSDDQELQIRIQLGEMVPGEPEDWRPEG